MERILLGMLIQAAVAKMDQVHQHSHQGILMSRQDCRQVESCRMFLQSLEKVAS